MKDIAITFIIIGGLLVATLAILATIRRPEKPDLPWSKRVKLAQDDTSVARLQLERTKLEAQTMIIERKRDIILGQMNEGNLDEAARALEAFDRVTRER